MRFSRTRLNEAAVAFLGSGELLCTFNPHTLVERSAAQDATRVIRALLMDVTTRRVTRTLDWHIPDDKQYTKCVRSGDDCIRIPPCVPNK